MAVKLPAYPFNGEVSGMAAVDDYVKGIPSTNESSMPTCKFVMCPPNFLSTRVKNNVWMKSEKIDVARALRQWNRAKNIIQALDVPVLEVEPSRNCQDQVYVANVGVAIEPYIILSKYKAPGRDCEIEPARQFFKNAGYQNIIQPPFSFEGEADMKRLNENTFFGGYGQFTDIRTHRWIEEKTGVQVISLRETNPKLYHLDCSLLVVDEENVLVTKEGLDSDSIREIERVANVITTPSEVAITGCTNAVIIPEKKIVLSGTFYPEVSEYRTSMEWMNATFDQFGITCVFLDVDEFDKSGADLSCAIFHLDF